MLYALEETPRYREAQELLLRIAEVRSESSEAAIEQPQQPKQLDCTSSCLLQHPKQMAFRRFPPSQGVFRNEEASAIALTVLLLGSVAFAVSERGGWRGGWQGGYRSSDDRNGVPVWESNEKFPHDCFTFVRVRYDSYGRARRWLGNGLSRCRFEFFVAFATTNFDEGESLPSDSGPY